MEDIKYKAQMAVGGGAGGTSNITCAIAHRIKNSMPAN